MALILVRHAHAGARRDWAGDDRLRPLSPKGRRQSEGLVGLLEPFACQRVLSSPYERCVDTLRPLAERLSLRVEPLEELAEGNTSAALALVRALSDEKVAVCTHGDVVAEVLVSLADEDRLDLGEHPRQAKGSAWALEASGGRFVSAHYLPAREGTTEG
ncbi:MAG: phosphoglycerate mutase family protein [Actinomycetota bacterium]|nr:phosphoglycerate mutase family protein [Actinomycetota bacterium]